jgi:hypothetical protein
MWTERLLLASLVWAIGLGAQAQTLDSSGLAALQSAVREMCVQPDRKGNYLRVEGDLNAGATLRVVGVNGQGKVTKEDWDGISQRLDQYKTDPRACAISLVGILVPILVGSQANKEISVECVAIHLRKNKQNDTKLTDNVIKIIADMGFRNCGITFEENNKLRHLSVDFFDDSAKMKNEATRLATKVRETLPREFQGIQANRERVDDPKYEEKDKLGLYLMP